MNRALLVVDMQNGFCHPQGSFTRRAAIPVVFTRHLYRPGRADEGQALKQNSPALAGLHGLQAGCCAAQTRRLHELSLEVLTSYRLARIQSIEADFNQAQAETEPETKAPVTA